MTDEEAEAWKRLAHAQRIALEALKIQVRQIALATAALMSTLDERDWTSIGEAALADLGDAPECAQAASIVAAFARDPAAAFAEQWASVTMPTSEDPLESG